MGLKSGIEWTESTWPLNLQGIDWRSSAGVRTQRAPRPGGLDSRYRDQCQQAGVAFFFKQWGGRNKKKSGRLLEDRTWDEMPTPGESAR
jgi:protein gp37